MTKIKFIPILVTCFALSFFIVPQKADSYFDEDFFYPETPLMPASQVVTSEVHEEEEEQLVPRPPVVNVQAVRAQRNIESESVAEEKEEEAIVQTSSVSTSPMDVNLEEDNTKTNFEETHALLNMTPDKSEMIRLEKDAASIIVGNPNHISVHLDTPDTLVVVPRSPGASHFTVVAKDGTLLMQRHVVVAAPKEQYVRIRRSCDPGNPRCQSTSVYYCPNMCHEVSKVSDTRRR
ncbi:MAG: pilus assembly protein N-terminal domain-containing protein [Pseudomonadota bacterium]